jgi:phospholipid/cholesterol/gamma-HCH transport system ATP-binding protein
MTPPKQSAPSDADDTAIQIRSVYKAFGSHEVLKGIRLTVPRGKITTIIGGSGSGKSVLIKHIIGLLQPDRGRVFVDGEDITRLGSRALIKVRAKFGMLFQHSALFDSMTVEDNVAFPLREHTKLSRKEIQRQVAEKLEVLGLAGMGKKWPAELSGGMRKRVGLARAITMNPSFLIYDEPTTGLDPVLAAQVDEMIGETQDRLGVTSVVISHDMASTFRLAHQIAMIHDGQIVCSGTPNEIAVSEVPQVQQFIRVSGVQLEAVRHG